MTAFLVLIATNALPGYAASTPEEEPAASTPKVQTTLTADLVALRNPEGVMLFVGGYRRWIQDMTVEVIPSRYVQTGLGLGISPAYAKAAVSGEWKPAVFFKLRLEYDYLRYFGRNGGLLSFPTKDSRFGKREIDALEDKEEKGSGQRILFQPTLYAKAGSVIICNQTDLLYARYNGNGPYFLDREYDTFLKDGDLLIANRTQFLVQAWKGKGEAILLTGPYYEITHAGDADINRQRMGALLYWVARDISWGMNRPRIYALIGVNIQDRNRYDEMYLVLGFGTDFDL
jgi:hypothetical protein